MGSLLHIEPVFTVLFGLLYLFRPNECAVYRCTYPYTYTGSCPDTCYRQTYSETWCWNVFKWFWCTKSRTVSYACSTSCRKTGTKCCDGYGGRSCTPICSCLNGGVCVAPNTCMCSTGFAGSVCTDVNECADGSSGCTGSCTNTVGSYTCSCPDGYQLFQDQKTCVDVNECSINNGNCEHTCSNTDGSFHCTCNNGFTLQANGQDCEDVNECADGSSGCTGSCTNTVGSYTCSCPDGYQLFQDQKTCVDIDECLSGNGGCSHSCNNTLGAFHCECPSGYQLDRNQTTCIADPVADNGVQDPPNVYEDTSDNVNIIYIAVMVVVGVLVLSLLIVTIGCLRNKAKKKRQIAQQPIPNVDPRTDETVVVVANDKTRMEPTYFHRPPNIHVLGTLPAETKAADFHIATVMSDYQYKLDNIEGKEDMLTIEDLCLT